MKRRPFLKLAVLGVPAALVSRPALGGIPGADARTPVWVFYDDRFADARAIARHLSPGLPPTPVGADVTALWNGRLKALCRSRPLHLQGVTTDSFHFCLTRLLRSRAGVETRRRRVGRDLYAWSIVSTVIQEKG